MQEIRFVVEEAEDGSYRANAAAAAIHTEADTLDPGQVPPLIRLHRGRHGLLA